MRAKTKQRLPLPELSALTEAGLAIVRAQLDLDGLCELVYQQVASLVDARGFHLGLFEGDSLKLKVWVHNGRRLPPTEFPGGQDLGIVGWVRSTRQPLVVHDFPAEMDQLPARPQYVSENPPRSALFVPLVAADKAVGSMSIQHPEPNAYTAEDLQLLTIIANQAASAIVNAQLFQTIGRRVDQLITVGEVSKAIAAELDLDALLGKVVELIRERFGYYHVQVFLVEDERHQAIFRASTGHDLNKRWIAEGRRQDFGVGIIGYVAESGQHLLANDVTQEPRYLPDDPRLLPDTRSEVAVPLKVDDQTLGVLDVQSRELNGFDDDDLYVLNALANQVALAVDSAWSYRAQQEEAWLSTVLLQAAHVVSRANTLDDVLTAVTRLTPILAGVHRCGVWLQNQDGSYELASSYGLAHSGLTAEALRMQPTLEPIPALALLGRTRSHVDLQTGDDFMLPARFWQALPAARLILLPLLAQNRLIGCLLVGFDRDELPLRLRDKRLSLLNGIANQTAAAIENVRLANAREEEAWISWALLEASQALANARSVHDMLEQIVRLTPLLTGVDRCAVLLRETHSGDFVVAQYYLGRRATLNNLAGARLQPGELPLLDLAVETRRLQRAETAATSALISPEWRERIGSQSVAVVPLLVQDEVLGVLLVDNVATASSPYRMSERGDDILTGIARQLSVHLENFQLQAQERERIRLTQELQVAQRIQASLLPAATPMVPGYELAHSWEPAREVGGDFYDFIPLSHGNLGLLIADVADKGVPAALFMATTSTLLRMAAQSHTAPDQMLQHANTGVNANNREDMFVTAWYGVLDPRAHTVDFANAGHSMALHVQAHAATTHLLRPAGIPLGILDDLSLQREQAVLEAGDLLVLYTDGVVDALDEAGEEFGQARLEAILLENRRRSAGEVVDAMLAAIASHAGATPLFDDVALVVLRRHPNSV